MYRKTTRLGSLINGTTKITNKKNQTYNVKYFAVSDWVEKDLITVMAIPTAENVADVFTKQTPRNLFYRHYDKLMGRVVPSYVQFKQEVMKLASDDIRPFHDGNQF